MKLAKAAQRKAKMKADAEARKIGFSILPPSPRFGSVFPTEGLSFRENLSPFISPEFGITVTYTAPVYVIPLLGRNLT